MNNALKLDCIKYGYHFIENSNILPDNLTFYSININRVGYKRGGGGSAHCDEDTFITQSNIIPNSFDNTKHNDIVDAKIGLTEMKIECPEKIIFDHLNINSTRNKFDSLSFIIDTNIDILLISDTKLHD